MGKEITPKEFQLHIIKVKLPCSGFSRLAAATSALLFPPLASRAAAPKPQCEENPRTRLCSAQYHHRHWSGKHANETINQELITLGSLFLLQGCFDSKIRYYTEEQHVGENVTVPCETVKNPLQAHFLQYLDECYVCENSFICHELCES